MVSAPSCPAVETATANDLQARRLLQCGQGLFQKWPEGFAGFTATLCCREGREHVAGDVRIFGRGRVGVRLDHGGLRAWAERSLRAISLARTPRFFKDGDGRFPISFDPRDDPEEPHPVGRGVRVHLGEAAWRAYRIDARGRIRQQEDTPPTGRVTAYEAFERACPGRILPTRMRVLDWDAAGRSLVETAAIEDAYERRGHVWLPVCRRARLTPGPCDRERVLELSGRARL
jgi:hypothetical protein